MEKEGTGKREWVAGGMPLEGFDIKRKDRKMRRKGQLHSSRKG
jgi:hypothetical protein